MPMSRPSLRSLTITVVSALALVASVATSPPATAALTADLDGVTVDTDNAVPERDLHIGVHLETSAAQTGGQLELHIERADADASASSSQLAVRVFRAHADAPAIEDEESLVFARLDPGESEADLRIALFEGGCELACSLDDDIVVRVTALSGPSLSSRTLVSAAARVEYASVEVVPSGDVLTLSVLDASSEGEGEGEGEGE